VLQDGFQPLQALAAAQQLLQLLIILQDLQQAQGHLAGDVLTAMLAKVLQTMQNSSEKQHASPLAQ